MLLYGTCFRKQRMLSSGSGFLRNSTPATKTQTVTQTRKQFDGTGGAETKFDPTIQTKYLSESAGKPCVARKRGSDECLLCAAAWTIQRNRYYGK